MAKKIRKTASEKAVEEAKIKKDQEAGVGKLREIQAKDKEKKLKEIDKVMLVFDEKQKDEIKSSFTAAEKNLREEMKDRITKLYGIDSERFNGEVKLVITKKNSETTGKVEVHIKGSMKGIEDDVEFIIKVPIELAKRYLPEQDIQIESWNPQTKL
jgi:NCAIR mutase (PurE)-related protein